ncbi:phosphohexomutase domain-containing protein [Helicovermis profundi]|uniref:Phosphoglucomutase n=1 Tax=Helicovermis profundi TaxID=3065157 RepID=A0AAU9EDI5_9FIRM|nr:phosphoglucomutase [Clostridia bacterium S502]
MQNYKILQNGSDIRGIALDGYKDEKINFTKNESYNIAISFVNWLSQKVNKPKNELIITVGNDSRLTGDVIKEGILSGIIESKAIPYDCKIASTPSMFMTTIFDDIKADGAIMITASHLPYNRNGMKFFTNVGGLDKKDISEILSIEKEFEFKKHQSENYYPVLDKYSDYLCNIIKKEVNSKTNYDYPLMNFKILVDAGNGAGGFFAEKVLEKLGANTNGSQFLEPDGSFPNHIPNPEDKDAMNSVIQATLNSKADLGIIFDTDVDRAAIVDKSGNSINRNKLIALMSAITLREFPKTTIVTDSVTSVGLSRFIENLGGSHLRFKRGYKNVINKSIELNKENIHSSLAIETSGHGAFKENYFLDDGAYIITKILIEASRLKENNMTISDLISDLEEVSYDEEIRLKIKSKDFLEYGQAVLDEFEKFALNDSDLEIVKPNYEGVRVNFDFDEGKGWLLLRMSLHDPVMPINIESNTNEGLDKAKDMLNSFLSKYSELS